MSPLDAPRRFGARLQTIDIISLDGCLDGASTVSSVIYKPLKTFTSTVLDGPVSPTPHTPYSPRARSLGRSLGLWPFSLAGKSRLRTSRAPPRPDGHSSHVRGRRP
jgi:hypothetical protein